LIGNDVNFAVTRSVWDACYHDPRYAPSVLQEERLAAGYLGRKSGRGFYPYGEGALAPVAATMSMQRAPQRVTVHGDPGLLAPLVDRLAGAGIGVDRREVLATFADGALIAGDAVIALSDGRTATERSRAAATPNLVLLDLALDFARCK